MHRQHVEKTREDSVIESAIDLDTVESTVLFQRISICVAHMDASMCMHHTLQVLQIRNLEAQRLFSNRKGISAEPQSAFDEGMCLKRDFCFGAN